MWRNKGSHPIINKQTKEEMNKSNTKTHSKSIKRKEAKLQLQRNFKRMKKKM
jgi:hypothetical protein